jgi:osmotically-inducible protein OsmY
MSNVRWLFAAAAAAFLIGSCNRTDTEANVRKALDEANIPTVEVHVNGDENIVHLIGTVETLADRTRAEEVAAAAVGTSGRVVNELTVEALEEPADDPDEELTRALDRLIDKDAVLRERDVNIEVKNGAVTITGEVSTAAERERVTGLLGRAPGVGTLTNQLQIHTDH